MKHSLLAVFGIVLLCGTAQATPTVVYFCGSVDEIQFIDPSDPSPGYGGVQYGDEFWGLFWYDLGAPAPIPAYSDAQTNYYNANDLNFGYSVNIPNIGLSYSAVGFEVYVSNTLVIDSFSIYDNANTFAFPDNPYFIDDILLSFNGDPSSLLNQNIPDDLNAFIFQNGTFWFEIYGYEYAPGTPANSFGGTIDSFNTISPVPEPGTLLLVSIGFTGFFARRKLTKQ